MLDNLWVNVSNYQEFKQDTHVKEYGKLRGLMAL